jgi:hypothetical protein
MTRNEDSLLNEITNTISVAVLIYLTVLVIFASLDVLGLDFGISPPFSILLPMGVVYIAFTLYYYKQCE